MTNPRPTILIVSEDASKDAVPTLRVLIQRLLRSLCPSYQEQRLLLQPLDDAHAQRAVHGNRWKSRHPRDRQDRVALMHALCTHLLQDERSFVVFHVDGDRAYADRHSSENRERFEAFRDDIAVCMAQGKYSAAEIQRVLHERLLLLMPFYSIEAWLYQNAERAIKLCHQHHGGRDVECFRRWAADRSALDELLRPKELVCLRDRRNRELAERDFPLPAVLAAQKSLFDALRVLQGCTPLQRALDETRP